MSALAYDTTTPTETVVVDSTPQRPGSPENMLIDERVRYARATGTIVSFREVLTPALAAALLERNVGNRDFSRAHVESLTAAIKRGEWRETHQAIAVSSEGVLLDGQHRCKAVILADQPIVSLISFGTHPDAFSVIDTGRPRRAHDVLSIVGMDSSRYVAATARFIYLLDNGEPGALATTVFNGRRSAVSNACIVSTVEREPHISTAVAMFRSIRHDLPSIGVGFAGGIVCILRSGADEDEVWKFAAKVGTGIGITDEHDPVFLLRQAANGRADRRKNSKVYISAGLTVKAWNLIKTGRRAGLISFKNNEPFPAVVS